MEKIALLGDSIRQLGYGKRVTELLDGMYTVYQPDDNGKFCYYTLRGVMLEWKEELMGCNVIHWNNGLWDTCDLTGDGPFTPLSEYCSCMLRIARILKGYSKHVIFATTTVPRPEMWGHSLSRIKLYNETLVPLLKAEGVLINDLYTPVANDVYGMICDDLLHLTPLGIEKCAHAVANAIKLADRQHA